MNRRVTAILYSDNNIYIPVNFVSFIWFSLLNNVQILFSIYVVFFLFFIITQLFILSSDFFSSMVNFIVPFLVFPSPSWINIYQAWSLMGPLIAVQWNANYTDTPLGVDATKMLHWHVSKTQIFTVEFPDWCVKTFCNAIHYVYFLRFGF